MTTLRLPPQGSKKTQQYTIYSEWVFFCRLEVNLLCPCMKTPFLSDGLIEIAVRKKTSRFQGTGKYGHSLTRIKGIFLYVRHAGPLVYTEPQDDWLYV